MVWTMVSRTEAENAKESSQIVVRVGHISQPIREKRQRKFGIFIDAKALDKSLWLNEQVSSASIIISHQGREDGGGGGGTLARI